MTGAVDRSAQLRRWRIAAVLLGSWAVAVTATLLWQRLITLESEREAAEAVVPDRLVLAAATYDELTGWSEDRLSEALPALERSCTRFRFLGADHQLRPPQIGGAVADWLPFCEGLAERAAQGEDLLRQWIEASLTPLVVSNRDQTEGLFTGYYEPLLHGSRRRSDRYRVPLYRVPSDLVSVELGEFREDLDGRRIAGRLHNRRLRPYADRSEIENGALSRQGLELAWVDDPIAAFFLQIQGSGQIELPDGQRLRFGYAGQNGHPYYAIGRELVARGALLAEAVTLQSIRGWLAANPEEAAEVMATNRSYIFFRELQGEGPIGTQGVALTPGRSLAVDRRFIPLGAPLWLKATVPAAEPPHSEVPMHRLVVAQDTGGAIRGPVRGDLFWGAGEQAEAVAGRMKHGGRYWLLIPRTLAERAVAATAHADSWAGERWPPPPRQARRH